MRTPIVVLASVLGVGCVRSAPSAESKSDAPPAVSIAGAPTRAQSSAVPPGPKRARSRSGGEHRVHGAIEGRFVPSAQSFVVGEPIVVQFSVSPTSGPLRVFVGGDGRNMAGYPMRVAVRAVDVANGSTVCDNVESPPFPSFGGIGSEQTFARGAWLKETFVLNPACPGLGKPGRYRVTLHRRITHLDLTFKKPGASHPTSCDMHPIHEGPAGSGEPECDKLLDAVPSVTSVFELSIAPFDAVVLRRAMDVALRGSEETARHQAVLWACGWLACACSQKATPTNAEVLAALPKALPRTFPEPCP